MNALLLLGGYGFNLKGKEVGTSLLACKIGNGRFFVQEPVFYEILYKILI